MAAASRQRGGVLAMVVGDERTGMVVAGVGGLGVNRFCAPL